MLPPPSRQYRGTPLYATNVYAMARRGGAITCNRWPASKETEHLVGARAITATDGAGLKLFCRVRRACAHCCLQVDRSTTCLPHK